MESLKLAVRHGPHYYRRSREHRLRKKAFHRHLRSSSLFPPFPPRVGKNLHLRSLPYARAVPGCMLAVICTFRWALQSTPLPMAWSRAARMRFFFKLLLSRVMIDLFLLFTDIY